MVGWVDRWMGLVDWVVEEIKFNVSSANISAGIEAGFIKRNLNE